MGEANDESRSLIASVLGSEPHTVLNADGTLSLHLNHIVITTEAALWGDPNAFLHADGTLSVSWGGQSVRIPPEARHSGDVEVRRNPLQGRARFVT